MKRRDEDQAHAGEVVSGSGKHGKPRPTETKNINVIRPNEEAAKRWANKIKREKKEQKERDELI